MRVVVPFQRAQKVGVVIAISDKSDIATNKLRRISEIFPDDPLPEDVIKVVLWAANYYHHPVGMAFETALPAGYRRVKPMQLASQKVWALSAKGTSFDPQELKRAPKQQQLLNILRSKSCAPDELNAAMKSWRPIMKRLAALELVEEVSAAKEGFSATSTDKVLNPEQDQAIESVNASIGKADTFLLHGITGSGKTEVYLNIVAHMLSHQQQCLLLVPEIGLTPQTVSRFQQRFGEQVSCVHSGLSDGERLTIWQQIARGETRVLIGTRSALFAPFQSLGCIIVDEEHDRSFKQQDGFRYHARDLAVYRAHLLKIPVVLGSATPSFESLHNAQTGRYHYLQLTQRAGNAVPPVISVVDSNLLRSHESLTPTLRESMQSHLERGEQVLLFLNRRGYAPALMCKSCQYVCSCHRCDAKLTYHANREQLICHHCGYEMRKPKQCPSCHSEDIIPVGSGTERLEEELNQYYPDFQTVRIDRDTTRRKGALQETLAIAREGKAQILIGTQMLAKGHDFPNVTLVGMINIDHGLFSTDFRGSEQMAQLIVQVSGRAGRADKKGKVIIQSALPDHPLLSCLIQQGYNTFSQNALGERQQLQLPPFSFAALIRAETPMKSEALNFLYEVGRLVNQQTVEKLGPATAPMEKRAGRFRAQLWLQSQDRKALHDTINFIQQQIATQKNLQQLARKVRWSVDVDPVEIF